MRLKALAGCVAAWLYMASAGAADVDWAHWSQQRREALFRDLPAEMTRLQRAAAEARGRGDAVAYGLAAGWLLLLGAEYDEPVIETLSGEVQQALKDPALAGPHAGHLALLLGAARHHIKNYDALAAPATLDEAERLARALGQPAMQAEVSALRALFLVYEGDAPGAQAAIQQARELNRDGLFRAQVFLGPQFLSRILTIHQPAEAQPLLAEIDEQQAQAPEALPYLPFLLDVDKTILWRRVRQPEEAQRVLQSWLGPGQRAAGLHVPPSVHLLQAALYRDMKQWRACVEALEPRRADKATLAMRVEIEMGLAVCHAGQGTAAQAQAHIAELEKALPALKSRPAVVEAALNAQARAYELLGDFPAAYAKAKATRAATLDRFSRANEAARQRVQTAYDVAAKDRENLLLKTEQEVLERRRQELSLAAAVLAIGLLVLVELLRRQSSQRRRLAELSTALERTNEQLTETNQRLESLNASRTRMLAAACHDLRQPAHALGMLSETAVARADPASRVTLEQIRRCSASLSDLLDSLFDLSRLEAERYVPQVGPVLLGEILADLRVHFALTALRKGLHFEVDEVDIAVVSDAHLLRRILMNLTSNALRYTVQGQVHVRAALTPDAVRIAVEDTGPGIPPERHESIFAEYVRLDASDRSDGLGIGLAIVRRSVDLLGHVLELASTPGRGTTFTLSLMRADRPEDGVASPTTAGRDRCVAVLEDDESVRLAMVDLLAAEGYAVVGAADAQGLAEALKAADRRRPELLITDLHLAGRDGLDLLQALRAADAGWCAVPTLLITGELDAELNSRAASLGVELAHKPLPPRKLLATVARLLEGTPDRVV